MPKGKKLTIKEKIYATEWVKNKGNGTQAALKAYDTDDPKTASVISAENLAKPRVQEFIEQALVKLELTPEWVLSKHKHIAEKHINGVQGSDGMVAERALENIGKIANLYPSANTNLELGDGKLKISWE